MAENSKLEEWLPLEKAMLEARNRFLTDEEVELKEIIDDLSKSLTNMVTEESEEEKIVSGIAATREKKIQTLGEK